MKIVITAIAMLFVMSRGAWADEAKRPVVYVGYAPERVYAIIHSAKLRVDAKMVLGSMSERTTVTQEQIQQEILLGRDQLPKSIRLMEKKEDERLATLLYIGQRTDRETGKDLFSRGTVTMVKEEGTWRLRHETWEDIPNPFLADG